MDKQNKKKYNINKSRQNMFWASCGYWIQDTFDIDFMEAHLYNLIMRKQFLVWTADYIASLFRTSSKTIQRMINHLVDIGAIKKLIITNGCKRKWVLIALYNEDGEIPEEEVQKYIKMAKGAISKYNKKNKESDILDKAYDKWISESLRTNSL